MNSQVASIVGAGALFVSALVYNRNVSSKICSDYMYHFVKGFSPDNKLMQVFVIGFYVNKKMADNYK